MIYTSTYTYIYIQIDGGYDKLFSCLYVRFGPADSMRFGLEVHEAARLNLAKLVFFVGMSALLSLRV